MRRLIILLLFPLSTFAQQLENKAYIDIPGMERNAHRGLFGRGQGTAASTNFDVKYYRCEWELDPAVRYIKGKVTAYFLATENTSSITLDLTSSLNADSVKQRNTILNFSQLNNTLVINFPGVMNAGVLDSVSIYYKGIPGNTGFGSFIQDSHTGTPVMWTLSEPYGARDWWPCKNGLDDKTDSIDVIITHPSIYKSASNGLLQSETLISGGRTSTHWKHRYPIATYLICMAVTNYSVFSTSVMLGNTNVPMITYCYPENLASFQAVIQQTLDAMKLYHDKFGDYPFIKEKYGHVQFGWGGGMEHQTSTFVISANESLVAHELGHQWFGDKVTTGSWTDIWLNEGFATYLSRFYMETKYPASAIANRQAVLANITYTTGGSVKVDDTTSLNRIFNNQLTYNKGSYLVQMLRFKLGDAAFYQGLRSYLNDPAHAYGFVRTPDLQHHMEQASGQNLTNFFNQWYAGQGYPSYHVEWSQLGSASVKINMSQVTSDPSVSFFEMPVPLKFKNATQEKTIIVDNKFNGETFVKTIGFVADSVFVDPDCWIISKNNTTTKITPSISGTPGVVIYQNPFSIYLHDFTQSTANITLINSVGQLVYKRDIALVNGGEIHQLNMDNLAKGMYVLKITADNFKYVQQLVK